MFFRFGSQLQFSIHNNCSCFCQPGLKPWTERNKYMCMHNCVQSWNNWVFAGLSLHRHVSILCQVFINLRLIWSNRYLWLSYYLTWRTWGLFFCSFLHQKNRTIETHERPCRLRKAPLGYWDSYPDQFPYAHATRRKRGYFQLTGEMKFRCVVSWGCYRAVHSTSGKVLLLLPCVLVPRAQKCPDSWSLTW